jgi:hypothetical protein
MVNLEELKMDYNFNLNRLYNGCNYLDEHPEDCDKYLNELFKVYNKVDVIIRQIEKYQKVTSDEVLGGFEI